MKNKHLLFAFALVLTAGFSAFAQEITSAEVALTGQNDQEVKFLDPMNPETWLNARRANQFSGEISIEHLLRAQQQVMDLTKKGSNSFDMGWEELGPNNIGGRTRAILIDPTNPKICYAGSVGGGIWKSTTGGTSWTKKPTTDGKLFDNQVVSSICRASNGDIYFGTGEGLANADGMPNNAYIGFPGQGVWKSTDDGETFQHVVSTWTGLEVQEAFLWVNAMAADPSNANRIYAATRTGVRMSDNAGQTWTNPIPEMVGTASDVQVGSDGTVIVSVRADMETEDCIAYISANGNDGSFTKISATDGTDVGLINELEISRLKFAFAPSDPNYIYCVAATYTRNNKGVATAWPLENVYQSTDKGQTWSVIGPGGSSWFEFLGNRGHYNIALAVDPSNPDFIMVGGADVWSWSYATGWERITLNEPTELFNRGYYIHINQHTLVWHPTDANTVYIGTNGGVSVSGNKGETWTQINRNFNVTQFFSVAFSNNGEVVGGSLDNGILFIDYQGNDPMYANWWGGRGFSSFNSYRHGGEVAISMLDPNMKFYTTPGGVLHRRIITEGQVTPQPSYYPYGNGGPWLTPMAIWESFNDPYSWDSVMYIADRDYAAGETVVTNSALGAKPLKKVLEGGLLVGDTLMIHDTYQGMIAVGKDDAAAIKVSRGALNVRAAFKGKFYSIIPRKGNLARVKNNDQVVEIEISKDGNYIYSAIWDNEDNHYKVYRVSNMRNARSRSTMDTDTGFDPITGEPTYVGVTAEIGTFDQIVTSLNVDPTNPDNLIVTCGNYGNDNFIYITNTATSAEDLSNEFVAIQGDLPQAPVFDAMFNWRDHKEVLVGTEYGVYSTKDIFAASPSWSSENQKGMEIVPVFELRQQQFENNAEWGIENHGTVYAATFGRGLWKSETFSTKGATSTGPMIYADAKINVDIHPNPVADVAQIKYQLDKKGDVEFQIFDLQGRMLKLITLNNQTAGDSQYNFDVEGLNTGSYIIKMSVNGQSKTSRFMVR